VNDGSFAFLWERPVTAVLVALSIACLLAPVVARWWRGRQHRALATTDA
jgi:TctA family transporter